jgi:hypothetical protein
MKTILLITMLFLTAFAFAQQRQPVALWVDTPETDVDCPKFETALRDAFARSPRYEAVDMGQLGHGALLLTVSCLSLEKVHVMSVFFTVQGFAPEQNNPLNLGPTETAHKLVINTSPEDFAKSILVSFDQSVIKHKR